MSDVTWLLSQTPVTDRDVSHYEATTGTTLPEDFKSWVLAHNGACPEPAGIKLDNGYQIQINAFLSLSSDDAYNALSVYSSLKDRLPEGVFPIAEDHGGNYLCLQYRSGSTTPTIVFWGHEEDSRSQIHDVCSSFEELLKIFGD